MGKVLSGVLLIIVLGLWAAERSKSAEIAKLEDNLRASKTMAETVSLEMQGKCAKQAAVSFAESGWKRTALVDYTNHYNAGLNKCFIEITSTEIEHGGPSHSTILADAFEGKVYGRYLWINSQGKKWWEVTPTECTVTTVSGDEKSCSSSEEFDALVKAYMQ
jgi:hypothetical protein